ncbi:SixA phosphatase family protein [Arcanobacterium canis]
MKKLYIMRHAQAGYSSPDIARELTVRGRRQAADAGARFTQVGAIDLAIVSGATRTRQTLEGLRAAGAQITSIEYDDDLYTAGQYSVLQKLHNISPDVHSVLLIGHEPTVSGVTALLSNGVTREGREAGRGFLPSQVAILEFSSSWAGLDMRGAQVVELWTPHQ